MKINYSGAAFESLCDVVNYIESLNTRGAGVRWLNRFENHLHNALSNAPVIKLCNNQTFKELQLRCINFKDWVIAFSLHEEGVLIEAVLHSSRITD